MGVCVTDHQSHVNGQVELVVYQTNPGRSTRSSKFFSKCLFLPFVSNCISTYRITTFWNTSRALNFVGWENWEGSLAANIEGEIGEFAYNKPTSGYFAWSKQSSHPNREIDDAAVALDHESCCPDGECSVLLLKKNL